MNVSDIAPGQRLRFNGKTWTIKSRVSSDRIGDKFLAVFDGAPEILETICFDGADSGMISKWIEDAKSDDLLYQQQPAEL